MGKLKQKYEKQKIGLKNLKIIFIIFIIIAILISIISVLAQYVKNNISNFFFESKEFYFYSDKLTIDGAIYQIDNWSGVDDYNITINMNSMKNNLKKTNYDIGYKVTYSASEKVICQLSKTEGIISSLTNTDSFNLNITPNAIFKNGDSVTVEIIAISTGEYEKELKATFKLVVGQENVTYEIEDKINSPYLELNITNTQSYYLVRESFGGHNIGERISINDYLELSEEDKNKCYSAEITITFDPNEILIDSTDKNYLRAKNLGYINLNGFNYVNKIIIEIEALSSENIRFYKKDKTKDYTYPIININPIVNVDIT